MLTLPSRVDWKTGHKTKGADVVPSNWRQRPTTLEQWPSDCSYLMSVDENGTAELQGIQKAIARGKQINRMDAFVTLTGAILSQQDFIQYRNDVGQLKRRFWPNGQFEYQGLRRSVCFHSRDIRKRQGPFAVSGLDYEGFLRELTLLLSRTPATVFSATVDKFELCRRYVRPYHPYELAFTFIVERFAIWLRHRNATGAILMESRGRSEDDDLLRRFIYLQTYGTQFVAAEEIARITAIYFNPKWGRLPNGAIGTFVSLELADLLSYPIHQYVRDGHTQNRAFAVVSMKLDGYPHYMGRGLKVFPQ